MATSRLLPLGDGRFMVTGVRVSPRNGRYIVDKKITGFRTESGAEYAVKDGKATRLEGSPFSPGIDYTTMPDGEWLPLVTTIEVGSSVYMSNYAKFRQTTPVEEVYYG